PMRLWTYAEVVRALPYLRTIARSLRDEWLAIQLAHQQLRRLDARPGRPGRQTLLLREAISGEAELAAERFKETLRELMALGAFCRDPVNGLVLVPCQEGNELAWFVFDLFAPLGQELSRFHAAPSGSRGTLVEKLDPGLVDELFAWRNAEVSTS